MAKQIISVTRGGQKLLVVVPNLYINSFLYSKKVSYIEIFYIFGQDLIKLQKSGQQTINAKLSVILGLGNRVQQLLFFAEKAKKQGIGLLKINNQIKRKISDYKPYQVFQSYLIAYLDALHSIRDEVIAIDRLIGKNYSNSIWKQSWFKLDIDIRHLFHHIETPTITTNGKYFIFTSKRLDEIKWPKFFKNFKQAVLMLDVNDLGIDILESLKIWAKEYLKLLNLDATTELIKGFRKDGRFTTRKISLRDILAIANLTL